MPATSPGTDVALRDPLNREFFQKNISHPVFFRDTPISGTEPLRTRPQHLSFPLRLFVTKGPSSAASLHFAVCTISPRLLGAAEPKVKPVNRLSRLSRPRRRGYLAVAACSAAWDAALAASKDACRNIADH
jgi:hypothetical protein